jgi:hypothetical protein
MCPVLKQNKCLSVYPTEIYLFKSILSEDGFIIASEANGSQIIAL